MFLFSVVCVGIVTCGLMFTYMYGVIDQMSSEEAADSDIVTAVIMFLIYLLCILAFLYIMISVYAELSHELNIYELLGASQKRLIAVVGGMMFIILAVLSAVSQLLHAALYGPLFSKINFSEEYVYTFGDYCAIFGITLLSVYVFVFLYIYIKTADSSIVNYRKTIK